jgi:hypothetical protein
MEEIKQKEQSQQQSLKYTLEELMSYLEYQNLSEDQVMYIYFSINGDEEKAIHYKKLCEQKIKKDNEIFNVLKTEDEIKNAHIEPTKIDDNDDDEKPVKIIKQKNIKL